MTEAPAVRAFALFDTALGRCGIAWGDRGILAVHFPEHGEAQTRARIVRRFPDAQEAPPPDAIAQAIARITALLAGEADDLAGVDLDMRAIPEFDRRVYAVARTIPPGSTLTYGEVAARLGEPGAARAVGQALGSNPFPIVVPCHRVLAARGAIGGFSAPGGTSTKRRLLTIEGALADVELPLFGGG